jgi:hypothetical protein
LIFEYFSKSVEKKSSFITIWPEKQVLYMKTYIDTGSYDVQFLLEMSYVSESGKNIVEPGRPQMTI